jgi:serine/threonine protein kinase
MTRDTMMPTLTPGEMLDHYRIDAAVGHGGMSELYKATDTRTGQEVALKVPLPEMEADPILFERFKREEEIGQLLDHPGIVKTFRGEERSRVYMVMEWVEGRLLRSILSQERKLPIERSVTLTLRICDALDTMHKHGVVHRDLKPENIMVDSEDRIKIIDFGIAMKEDARRLTFVNLSATLGTPDYISPEQVRGQRGDQRSDIYAAGVMLYEMLTGQVPFAGPSPLASMNERLQHNARPVRELNPKVSPALEEIVYRALEREPRHRYATAGEMAWDLEHQEEVGVDERNTRTSALRTRKKGKRAWLLYIALGLVPILIFILMVLLARN